MRVTGFLVCAAAFAVSACGGADRKASANSANAQSSNQAAAVPAQVAPSAATPAANGSEDKNRVENVQRTTSDGRRIETRELVGPDVQPHGSRPLNMDEIQEIEKATGRPYQEGDSIHGRAKEVK